MNISEIPDAGRRNRKRANDCLMDDAEINNEPHSKISKFSTNGAAIYIKLAEEDIPERVCDSDDSTYDSFHGRETDLCRDTSDTEDYSSEEERQISMAVVEYEIASSDESDADTDALSSSGTDDFMIAAVAHAIYDDSSSSPSDFSLFADTEDSDSTSDDPELGKADYWECVKCKNRQNNPLYRYCEKCYQIRKNLFPPRPKKNRKTRLSQTSGIHKGHQKEEINPVFRGKTKNNFSYMCANSVGRSVSKVDSRSKSKEANSAGESSNSDDSDTEYQNDKILNFLSKSPKMCKRKKRLSNRILTDNTTKTDNNNSSSELGESSKKIIVLLNNSSTTTNRLTEIVPNTINVSQQSSSTKSTDSSSKNCKNEYSSQNINKKRTCDTVEEEDADENIPKRFRLDNKNEIKTFHNKMFKNVIKNWSGNSDNEIGGGDIIKLTPPNELDLLSNKDSGFSSSSSQELSPTQEFLNDDKIDNSSQETYCPELEIDGTHITQVYATSSTELSESSAKIGLLSRSASSCSDFTEIVSVLKSQDSFERTQNSEGFEMCMMCLVEPKNGVFVHNRFLHSCCCYKCAMKFWAKLKRCPICNCRVKNVMKLFVH